MNARRLNLALVQRLSDIICNQTILLNGFFSTQHYPENLRRIRFNYVGSGKTLIFLTNSFVLSPLTIASFYKSRWQVSRIVLQMDKQHLRIKKFLGNSENAVKTQIRCARPTAIFKKELQINALLYTLPLILLVSLFEKTKLSSSFQRDALTSDLFDSTKQLNLFEN